MILEVAQLLLRIRVEDVLLQVALLLRHMLLALMLEVGLLLRIRVEDVLLEVALLLRHMLLPGTVCSWLFRASTVPCGVQLRRRAADGRLAGTRARTAHWKWQPRQLGACHSIFASHLGGIQAQS